MKRCVAPTEAEAVRIAAVETYKVKDLWLVLDVMSPVDLPGSYSIAVVVYDNLEPVQFAGNSAVKIQSEFKVQQPLGHLCCQSCLIVDLLCHAVCCISALEQTGQQMCLRSSLKRWYKCICGCDRKGS